MTFHSTAHPDSALNYPKPSWRVNLLAVGILILLVLVYFFWQIRYAQNTFSRHVRDHAGMLAGVIRLNARNTLLAQKSIEEIIEIFLGHSARFIDYLDAVKPFSSAELHAYTLETGLAGIRIVGPGGRLTEGPPAWLPADFRADLKKRSLRHLKGSALYYLIYPRVDETGVIIVGYAAQRIEQLREETGLPRLLKALSRLPGIKYVRVEDAAGLKSKAEDVSEVGLFSRNGSEIAQARLVMEGGRLLVVGVEAAHFFKRRRQLWSEFFVFSALIALSGALVSWVLYRYQSAYLDKVRRLESRLAREREDAALGRASATIAHEIRNPLNAIGMGLQRLQMEAGELSSRHHELVSNLLGAVARTDGIVADLKRYAQPLRPKREDVDMASLISAIVGPYRQECSRAGIRLSFRPRTREAVPADPQLLAQVVENMVKNAAEAQPQGGFIDIELYRNKEEVVFRVENGSFSLDPGQVARMPEPYFTTKITGSGLGLAVVAKIVRAHGGRVNIHIPREGVLSIEVRLPLNVPDSPGFSGERQGD